MDKFYEHDMVLSVIFVDFKQANILSEYYSQTILL